LNYLSNAIKFVKGPGEIRAILWLVPGQPESQKINSLRKFKNKVAKFYGNSFDEESDSDEEAVP